MAIHVVAKDIIGEYACPNCGYTELIDLHNYTAIDDGKHAGVNEPVCTKCYSQWLRDKNWIMKKI